MRVTLGPFFAGFLNGKNTLKGPLAVGYHMLPGWILKTLRHEHRHWRGRLAGLRFSRGKGNGKRWQLKFLQISRKA